MRIPSTHLFARWSQAIALVCAGMIIGAAVHMLLYQHNMTEILTMNNKLKNENGELLDELEGYEKYKNNNSVIKTIKVEIEEPVDDKAMSLTEIDKNKITTKVQEYLNVIKGMQISQFTDPESDNSRIFRSLFGQKRVSNINEKDYILEIKTMVIIYSELRVRISVSLYKDIE